jgi:hypothetical protein
VPVKIGTDDHVAKLVHIIPKPRLREIDATSHRAKIVVEFSH